MSAKHDNTYAPQAKSAEETVAVEHDIRDEEEEEDDIEETEQTSENKSKKKKKKKSKKKKATTPTDANTVQMTQFGTNE